MTDTAPGPMPAGPPPDEKPPASGRALGQAVATALALLALIVVCYLLGPPAFFVLICVVVTIAAYEMVEAVRGAGHRPVVWFTLACTLAMLVVAYARRPALFGVVVAVAAFGGLLLALRPGRGRTAASDAAWTLLAVVWIGGGGAGATSIMVDDEGGLRMLVAFVLITALGDIAAYFTGTAFGRHKMAPSISPAKSWEGFAGGLAGALAGGAAFSLVVGQLGVTGGLVIGLICGLLGPVGDLIESLFKREIGIKDSGHILPGHGGLLDRLDAILFCAPATFLYLRFAIF